jgi:hypothetical protein
MTQTTVTYTLEEVLKRIENKIDSQGQDLAQLKVDMAEVKTELKFIKENTVTQKNQIWSLITILAVAVLGILATGAKIAFFP